MVRDIIEINEDLCNGCGNCVPGCHEGALQIIDGKARLISDLMCDGLGACVGHCPTGAMKVIQREAEAYDEARVMKENIIPAGTNTIIAHLRHLDDHNETEYLTTAIETLKAEGVEVPDYKQEEDIPVFQGCPGSRQRNLKPVETPAAEGAPESSQLQQWPVQMHLISPGAGYFKNSDMLLAADCTAFAGGGFHSRFLKGKKLAIACPKLDNGQESYVEKLIGLIDQAQINTLSVLIMEVPCCGGLLAMAQTAQAMAKRKIPLKKMVMSIEGELISEEWV